MPTNRPLYAINNENTPPGSNQSASTIRQIMMNNPIGRYALTQQPARMPSGSPQPLAKRVLTDRTNQNRFSR